MIKPSIVVPVIVVKCCSHDTRGPGLRGALWAHAWFALLQCPDVKNTSEVRLRVGHLDIRQTLLHYVATLLGTLNKCVLERAQHSNK